MEYVQLCRDNPAEYTEKENHSEAILHVEMKSYDLELWAFRLKDAMNKAELKINEWEPVGPPFGTHAILSNDSFPQIYNVTIRRTTQYLDLEEGFESEEDHIIAIEAEKEAEQTVKEMNEHVKHPGVGEHKSQIHPMILCPRLQLVLMGRLYHPRNLFLPPQPNTSMKLIIIRFMELPHGMMSGKKCWQQVA